MGAHEELFAYLSGDGPMDALGEPFDEPTISVIQMLTVAVRDGSQWISTSPTGLAWEGGDLSGPDLDPAFDRVLAADPIVRAHLTLASEEHGARTYRLP